MCRGHLAFLEALRNPGDANDHRDRRETGPRPGSRRIIAAFVLRRWRTIRAASIEHRGAAFATQLRPRLRSIVGRYSGRTRCVLARGRSVSAGFFAAASVAGLLVASASYGAAKPKVIELTQVPCQFIESENGIDRGYTTTKKADCDAINARTGEERVASSEPLVLKPGRYVFRVTNKNVPYELGFWLRGDGLVSRLRLPSVSGAGLMIGETQDYEIDLTPGEYVYSCPLNTTPDYKLVVRE